MASLKLESISKSFGKVKALKDINLEVKEGEFFTILGPSGCGKTTLLRIIAGLESQSAGEIYIDNAPQANIPPYQRPTSLVFQDYALFPHLSVFENVAYGLKKKKAEKSQIEKKVNELLELTHLAELKSRKPQELSGGEKQRVALCRSLAISPLILLLDEPLASLDAAIRQEMRRELKIIQRKIKTTFIYVTHDQEEAMILSDRMAVMRKGEIYQVDSPENIYNAPQSKFVAEFIGLANLLRMQVVRETGSFLEIKEKNGLFLSRKPQGVSFSPGERVYLMIRPEKISLSKEGFSGSNQIEGILEEIQYKGSNFLIFIKGEAVCLSALYPEVSFPFHLGDKIFASWKTEDGIIIKNDS